LEHTTIDGWTILKFKDAAFWDVALYRYSHLLTLILPLRIFPFSYTLKMEEIRSSETSVYIFSTRLHTPDDDILHSYRREIKSYGSKFVVK
jgi:hypothetical protein